LVPQCKKNKGEFTTEGNPVALLFRATGALETELGNRNGSAGAAKKGRVRVWTTPKKNVLFKLAGGAKN